MQRIRDFSDSGSGLYKFTFLHLHLHLQYVAYCAVVSINSGWQAHNDHNPDLTLESIIAHQHKACRH